MVQGAGLDKIEALMPDIQEAMPQQKFSSLESSTEQEVRDSELQNLCILLQVSKIFLIKVKLGLLRIKECPAGLVIPEGVRKHERNFFKKVKTHDVVNRPGPKIQFIFFFCRMDKKLLKTGDVY